MMFPRWFAGACCLILAVAMNAPLHAETPPATDSSTVVARQGNATVTLGDIDAFAQRMAPKERPVFFNSPKRLESLITSLLVQKQLAEEAIKYEAKVDFILTPPNATPAVPHDAMRDA